MRRIAISLISAFMVAGTAIGQSGNTAAGLAGIGAGAALGAGAGGSGGTSSSSAAGGNAPIEIQILSMHGLQKIAADVAGVVNSNKGRLCPEWETCSILLEDPTSSSQIALYRSAEGYIRALTQVHADLQGAFSLSFTSLPPTIVAPHGQPKTISFAIKNSSFNSQTITATTSGTDAASFVPVPRASCANLTSGESCVIDLTFTSVAADTVNQNKTATLIISYTSPTSGNRETMSVPISGNVGPPPPPAPHHVPPAALGPDVLQYLQDNGIDKDINAGTTTEEEINSIGRHVAEGYAGKVVALAAAPAAAAPTTSTGTASSPATPYSLQWTNGAFTDLSAAKAAYTYTPSSLQITTQAFEVLVESELQKNNVRVMSYTSTSPLNLAAATNVMSEDFGLMLSMATDVSTWTAQCGKTPQGAAPPGGQQSSSVVTYSACNEQEVISDLAVAQQLANGFSSLLTSANDGNGNPAIVDFLRGYTLSQLIGDDSIPSLQLAVLAAGGSSRTNSIFGVSLFYQFAPSYNAGVIATFELRDGSNGLVKAGARNVLYGYKKWNPGHINGDDIQMMNTQPQECTFCSSK